MCDILNMRRSLVQRYWKAL